jgi:hypothetical protein
MPCWTDASIVANKIFAYTRSAVVTATIIDVPTELLPLDDIFFKAMATIATISVDAFTNCVHAISTWSASMLLAGIYISALHIWCRVAEFAIGETFSNKRGRSIVLSTGSVSRLTVVSSCFLEVQVLTDFTIKLRIIERGHCSTLDSFTFLFVVLLELSYS